MKITKDRFEPYFMHIGIAVLLIVMSLLYMIGLGRINFILRNNANPAQTDPVFNAIYGILLLIGLLISVSVLLRYFIEYVRPMAKIRLSLRSLIEQDLPSIMNALSELTMGNLQTKLHLKSDRMPKKVPVEIRDLKNNIQRLQTNVYLAMEDFNTITDVPCKRLCYVGANAIEEGRKAGMQIGHILQGEGQIIVYTAFRHSISLGLRWKSCRNILANQFPAIKIVEVIETLEDNDNIRKSIEEIPEKYPDLAGIYTADAVSTAIIPALMEEIHPNIKLAIVGHDLTTATLQGIKREILSASLGQNPFAQGHDPLIYLYNHLNVGWQPEKSQIFTQVDVVTKQNVDLFWNEKTGIVSHKSTYGSLAKLADIPAIRPLRFAVLCREDNEFWQQIHQGVLSAKEKLVSLGVTVDWIVPEKSQTGQGYDSSIYGPLMQNLIENGKYDGITTVVFDKEFTHHINLAVEAGIPVIIMNSEPISLRSTISNIYTQADQVSLLSTQLFETAQQVLLSSNEIRNILSQVTDGAVSQNNQRERTQTTLYSLLNNIEQVSQQALQSEVSTQKTANAVNNSDRAIKNLHASLETIGNAVEKSMGMVKELKNHSEQIDDIVNTIDTISSKVNVLALNASIEATQSGKFQSRFTKVAKEIRKLAQNTADATREISDLVETIKLDVIKVARAINSGDTLIKNSDQSIESADKALNNIHQLIKSERIRVERIAASILEMQKLSHRVGMAMDHVGAVSNRNTKGMEENNKAIQMMNEKLNSITKMTKKLEDMSLIEKQFLAMFEADIN